MSNFSRELKIRLFTATVESILLYGSETLAITKSLSKKLMDATPGCQEWHQTLTGGHTRPIKNYTETSHVHHSRSRKKNETDRASGKT